MNPVCLWRVLLTADTPPRRVEKVGTAHEVREFGMEVRFQEEIL